MALPGLSEFLPRTLEQRRMSLVLLRLPDEHRCLVVVFCCPGTVRSHPRAESQRENIRLPHGRISRMAASRSLQYYSLFLISPREVKNENNVGLRQGSRERRPLGMAQAERVETAARKVTHKSHRVFRARHLTHARYCLTPVAFVMA